MLVTGDDGRPRSNTPVRLLAASVVTGIFAMTVKASRPGAGGIAKVRTGNLLDEGHEAFNRR